MTKLNADLAYWQRQLRLDNMDIKLRWMVDREDEDALAKNFPQNNNHNALIALRNPNDIPKMWLKDFSSDMEVNLVHELLHIRDYGWAHSNHFDHLFTNDDTLQRHHEMSIDAVAEALVRARRGMMR